MRGLPTISVTLILVASICGCPQQQATQAPSNTTPGDESGSVSTTEASAAPSDGTLSLSDFTVFPEDDDSWSEGETIVCAGKTKGYIYTNDSFGQGIISFDYRYPDDLAEDVIPNTGLLLLIEPPHKKWPRCIEAQGKQSEAGQLKGNGGVTDLEPVFVDEALTSAIKPPGEWNSVEVEIGADQITARWNGQQTATCGLGGLSSGPFGLQSEGNPVEFRNIRFVPATE